MCRLNIIVEEIKSKVIQFTKKENYSLIKSKLPAAFVCTERTSKIPF